MQICSELATMMQLQKPRPWSTVECSQPAAWTTNLSLLVTSRVKTFPGRLTNSGSILPRRRCGRVSSVYRDLAHGKCSDISRHASNPPALSCMHAIRHLHPCPHQPSMAMTNYTHASTVTNSSALHVLL